MPLTSLDVASFLFFRCDGGCDDDQIVPFFCNTRDVFGDGQRTAWMLIHTYVFLCMNPPGGGAFVAFLLRASITGGHVGKDYTASDNVG